MTSDASLQLHSSGRLREGVLLEGKNPPYFCADMDIYTAFYATFAQTINMMFDDES